MSGTVAEGKLAAKTNKKKYGDDFYVRNGAKGGRIGRRGPAKSARFLERRLYAK